ncbi:dihydrolipoyl dehydrogenase [Turicimonas muris]|uniref:Dihydrolipoyl dehydrogenase n=2 Tax=Turicimonas muris TaxID=1796652 RepID=A0A227KS31_9BURK|nr:dihydrolipoyl dehydrogenase [Turicimonas muris]ANU65507.1 dihydrolipoyl dehydrogenase [Burkholderiales bacterium YL45]MBS4769000.1 dihydrolipoyl dehydrogenase [Burkholderiales bacterium]OXE51319.1 dihydrolipoyl dehydrogenase [Turicimonas muris]QQQ96654.1 dihydrolipoyl dehydrogenase [Turicimonas muris]
MKVFDVAVIGAGPGGYVAAIRAAQLGMTVCVIDEWKKDGKAAPGGTCTNVGCIPSKALLASSGLFEKIKEEAAVHGITVNEPAIDVAKMMARKEKVIRQTNDGILYLFKKNKVEFFNARGSFVSQCDDGYILAVGEPVNERVVAHNVIIATGSVPRQLPDVPFDEKLILSNEGALSLTEVPKNLGIIGAGVIGLEMGSVWNRLGSEVRILEAVPSLLSMADSAVSKEALKIFTKEGLKMQFGVRIEKVETEDNRVSVTYKDSEGKLQEMWVEKLIVSIGRVPNTAALDGPAVGLKLDDRGFIEVDEECRTNLPGVWAIGDAVRGPMLAHKAEEEGVAVAERIIGRKAHVDLTLIPSVIYTEPEIAWIGKTEQQLKNEGREYKSGQVPFAANGRARASDETDGFVKILADAKTDELLGVHIVGVCAGELIAQAAQAMAFRAAAEDLALICQAHPSFSETVKEAALAVNKGAINL